jgi:O-methyltransferase
MTGASELLERFPLVSDQVNKNQLAVILREFEAVLDRGVEGSIVEFGCYIGTTSLFLRRLLDARAEPRELHVYDSFAGLPLKTAEDESRAGEQFVAGELAVSKKQFLQQFQRAALRPPIIHKGWFSDLTATDVPEHIACAFLDGDFYSSIRDSLQLVLPRLQPGGVIIIDDYAREALPGAARAAHELLGGRAIITAHNLGVVHL